MFISRVIREFKKLLRRRRRQRRLKNELILYLRFSGYSLVILFIIVKAITKLILGHRDKFEIEFYKISRRSSSSSGNAELIISRCCFTVRVVKGIFVTRDRPFFFPVKCEMAIFFFVNRDFHSSREA